MAALYIVRRFFPKPTSPQPIRRGAWRYWYKAILGLVAVPFFSEGFHKGGWIDFDWRQSPATMLTLCIYLATFLLETERSDRRIYSWNAARSRGWMAGAWHEVKGAAVLLIFSS